MSWAAGLSLNLKYLSVTHNWGVISPVPIPSPTCTLQPFFILVPVLHHPQEEGIIVKRLDSPVSNEMRPRPSDNPLILSWKEIGHGEKGDIAYSITRVARVAVV